MTRNDLRGYRDPRKAHYQCSRARLLRELLACISRICLLSVWSWRSLPPAQSGYCWNRDALLSLHEAAVKHLVCLYEEVNQFATLLTPYISDGTKLTPQEEQAAFSLSCDCASGIRTYVWTIKGSNRNLVFAEKFSKQYLSPYLGSDKWKAKVFSGNSLTPVEVTFQMTKEQREERRKAAVYGGWTHFVEKNSFKKGDACACNCEEEEDKKDGPLSLRVHLLREAPKC